ncbi:MAG TPA: calcium/proton exchanger [Gemmatimonadales bacterium]|jgi:Ca2+:H+ antiporter
MTSLETLRTRAVEESTAQGSGFVGAEHLFLAWLLDDGLAQQALVQAGISADEFRTIIASRRAPRPAGEGETSNALSSHAERALAAAAESATVAGRDPNGDDLFLALIKEPRGAIARALTMAKARPTELRRLVAPPPAARSGKRRDGSPPRERSGQPVQPAPVARKRDPEIDDIPEARAPERPRLAPPPRPAPAPTAAPKEHSWVLWIGLLAVPLTVGLKYLGVSSGWVFAVTCLGIIPLAGAIAQATEHLADHAGPTVSAVLNAAFGNATEVIVAIAALHAGYVDFVKASLTGSILGNLLLILGAALLAGGLRQPILKFNRTAAGMSSAMLAIAVAALMLPSMLRGTPADSHLQALSKLVAVLLAIIYLASLLFSLRTHRRIFTGAASGEDPHTRWPLGITVVVLAVATVLVAVESEFLVETIGPVTRSLGVSQGFLGLIVVPIVGNAAEHASAIVAARRGRIELAIQIALGSSTQVALLVAPILVLVGGVIGSGMNLVFPGFQVGALAAAVIVSALIVLDGESHWLEGVQLLALYLMIAAAAWFI